LGFIPEGVSLDGLEISSRTSLEEARSRFRSYQDFAFVRFSDAHSLEEIGKASTRFLLEERTSAEIKMALHSREGRRIAEG
jgi:PHP family Zn ribbon phosphoesterase